MLSPDLEKFIHPAIAADQLPKTATDLYAVLDSGIATKEQIGAVVRNRYADTAALLDAILYSKAAQLHEPIDLTSLIGQIGAFNYIRGMDVIKKDGTIDREVAPKIMLSPSASIQVLEKASLTPESRALEMFSGVGYFSFFLALKQPKVLDCVDLRTPEMYDLDATFKQAYNWIYGDLPQESKPNVTTPVFRQMDCRNLKVGPGLGITAEYTHVFLHPPYGRESKLLMDLSEKECRELWLNSLTQVSKTNKTDFKTFSVVPSEWTNGLEDLDGHTNTFSLDLRETRMFPLALFVTEVKR